MTDFIKSEQYIKTHRKETIETMCAFAQTDLLLFWSDDVDVYGKQQNLWGTFVEMMQNETGEKINISQSIQVPDNMRYLSNLKAKLQKISDKELTAAFLAALLTKSVILGLSLLKKNISVKKIFESAFLEEIYQNELWGIDEEAWQKRKQIKKELQKIKEYLKK